MGIVSLYTPQAHWSEVLDECHQEIDRMEEILRHELQQEANTGNHRALSEQKMFRRLQEVGNDVAQLEDDELLFIASTYVAMAAERRVIRQRQTTTQ